LSCLGNIRIARGVFTMSSAATVTAAWCGM
jgi:hypothetical protein